MKNISVYFNQLIAVTTNLIIVILLFSCIAFYNGRLFGRPVEQYLSQVESAKKDTRPDYPFLKEGKWHKFQKGIWQKLGAAGDITETVICSKKYASDINGYGGPIALFIHLDAEDKIMKITVGENYETPFFLDNVLKSDFFNQFAGESIKLFDRSQYDTVTGATVSSSAIIASVGKAGGAYSSLLSDKPVVPVSQTMDKSLFYKNVLALMVFLFALLLFLFFKGSKLFRLIQLFLNVIVLGGVCGTMLSMQTFLNLVNNGINFTTALVPVIIIATILILNFFGKKNFYCTWVCPFGSAQELVGKITKINISFGKKYQIVLNNLRTSAWLSLLFFSWITGLTFVFDYEPFTVFLLTQAAAPVLMIAGVFLFLSVFVKKCWCKYFCPTGATFNFIQTTNK